MNGIKYGWNIKCIRCHFSDSSKWFLSHPEMTYSVHLTLLCSMHLKLVKTDVSHALIFHIIYHLVRLRCMYYDACSLIERNLRWLERWIWTSDVLWIEFLVFFLSIIRGFFFYLWLDHQLYRSTVYHLVNMTATFSEWATIISMCLKNRFSGFSSLLFALW